jgi:hypothetical protein
MTGAAGAAGAAGAFRATGASIPPRPTSAKAILAPAGGGPSLPQEKPFCLPLPRPRLPRSLACASRGARRGDGWACLLPPPCRIVCMLYMPCQSSSFIDAMACVLQCVDHSKVHQPRHSSWLEFSSTSRMGSQRASNGVTAPVVWGCNGLGRMGVRGQKGYRFPKPLGFVPSVPCT